jgi:hypothetical protein
VRAVRPSATRGSAHVDRTATDPASEPFSERRRARDPRLPTRAMVPGTDDEACATSLRGSRTNGSGSCGWCTPNAPSAPGAVQAVKGVRLREPASLQELPENGASRARTGDLLGAIQALSQLSYSPVRRRLPRGALQFSLGRARGLTRPDVPRAAGCLAVRPRATARAAQTARLRRSRPGGPARQRSGAALRPAWP